MSKSYGRMCSFADAIKWASRQQASNVRDWAIARMKYEASKARPLEPRLVKGVFGNRYDHYVCRNCGFNVNQAYYNYCPNCGRKLTDIIGGRRKTQAEQDMFSDYSVLEDE